MGSGAGESVENVRKAVEILKERNVDFAFDGEMQADAALVPEVGEHKAPLYRCRPCQRPHFPEP